MYLKKDIEIIRDLCKKYMEIAESDRHVRMRRRFKDTNDLKVVRPPLIIEEIPWQQMNYEHALDCVCGDAGLRSMEYGLRVALFREKYFKCDNYIEPCWVVRKAFSSTGNGLDSMVKENVKNALHTDIKSHEYHDVLENEDALQNFHLPKVTAYPEADENNVNRIREIVGDTIPVVLRGHGIYDAPWDRIARLRGVQSILYDMYDRPEYLLKIRQLYADETESYLSQMDSLGLLENTGPDLHCTPAYVEMPEGDHDRKRLSGAWYRTMAQMFSTVSPDDLYEYDIKFSIPAAEKCAYTYYGCCEPLHDRIEIIKRIPNLRKIGCSPWADVERTAEQIKGDFVLSRKPNPAFVSSVADPEQIRKEAEETVKACLKHGCPCDITLKDISTVGDRPENLIVWSQVVSEVLDEYYEKE
ncbi:MAG: hypothetical protein J6330_05375 [Clostridia bacterium]|nr:hypothetical protein [Clostridia bacterium]